MLSINLKSGLDSSIKFAFTKRLLKLRKQFQLKRNPWKMLISKHSMTFFKTLNDDNTDTDDTADPDLTNVDIDHGINEEISTNEI